MPCKPDSTHFHGCDCWEDAFKDLLKAAKEMRKAYRNEMLYASAKVVSWDNAIKKAEERCG